MLNYIRNIVIGISALLIFNIGYAQAYTPEEAFNIYTNNGCKLKNQTRIQICFEC